MSAPCPTCGYALDPAGATHCGLCGARRGHVASPAFVEMGFAGAGRPPGPRVSVGWRYLIVGMVLALAFTLAPWLRFMGWFLGSLFHETGHVAFSWFVGCPAWPAISLRGHAAAFHQPQNAVVLALLGLGLGAGVLIAWQNRRHLGLAIALLLLWPLVTFVDGLREVGFLLSGHLGELVFAGVFLWRARTGSAIEHEAERPLYACVGWFLLARNIVLTGALTFTESARSLYMTNGSFGLTNDYVRVAGNWLHVPLQAVTGFMLLIALGVFPLVLALTWSPDGEEARESFGPRMEPAASFPESPPAARPVVQKRVLPRSRVRL